MRVKLTLPSRDVIEPRPTKAKAQATIYYYYYSTMPKVN